jgi:hypothetical protein
VEQSRRTTKKVKRSVRGDQSSDIIKTSNSIPNNNGRFHLYVEAALGNSKEEGRLGAALWQEDEHGIKQVIEYASRRLTASESS